MALLALILLLSAWIWAKLAADGARVPVVNKKSVQLGKYSQALLERAVVKHSKKAHKWTHLSCHISC